MSDFNFTGTDTSTPSTSELTSELTQIPGLGGVVGNVGVNNTSTTSALPSASANSMPSANQLASELQTAIGQTGFNTNSLTSSLTSSATLSQTDFRTTLQSKANTSDKIIFTVSPSIDESRAANYEHLSPVHHPGTIQVYKSTEARTFNITAKLIARTAAEATANLTYINLIRSWVMPYYGTGTAASQSSKLGAPPDILLFSSYGTRNINQLPVVLLNYHWVFPDNVDYIPTNDGLPCPTMMDVSLALIEAYSPEEYTGFDLTKYKTGDMVGAYTFSSTPASSSSSTTNSNPVSYSAPQGASVTNSPTSL
jgi:hypothetical protein